MDRRRGRLAQGEEDAMLAVEGPESVQYHDKVNHEHLAFKWILGIWGIIAVTALIIAIVAIAKIYGKQAPLQTWNTYQANVYGVCSTSATVNTIGINLFKAGQDAMIELTNFTCNGLNNASATTPAPIWIPLPAAYRSDVTFGSAWTPSLFSAGITHNGDHPSLAITGQFENNGTIVADIAILQEIAGVPTLLLGLTPTGGIITPSGGLYGPWTGRTFRYRAYSAAPAVAGSMVLGALGLVVATHLG